MGSAIDYTSANTSYLFTEAFQTKTPKNSNVNQFFLASEEDFHIGRESNFRLQVSLLLLYVLLLCRSSPTETCLGEGPCSERTLANSNTPSAEHSTSNLAIESSE